MDQVDVMRLARAILDVDSAVALLPQGDQDAYRRAQESVVEARDLAQEQAGETWVH